MLRNNTVEEEFTMQILGCKISDLVMLEDVYSQLAEECIYNVEGLINECIGECGIGECFNTLLYETYRKIIVRVFDYAIKLVEDNEILGALIDMAEDTYDFDTCKEIEKLYYNDKINLDNIKYALEEELDNSLTGIYCNYLDTHFGGICKDWLDLDTSLDSNANCILREVMRNIEWEELVVDNE